MSTQSSPSIQPWAIHLQDISDFIPSSRISEGLKVAIGKLVLHTHINKDKKSAERKDLLNAISKDKAVLQGFIHLLETSEDNKVIRNLVSMNLSISIIKSFVNLYKNQELNDHSVGCIFWILSALATKDTKFSIKIRLCDAVKPISSILRFTLNKQKLIYPIVQVIKSISRNIVTGGALGKDGVIPMIVCIIDDNFCLHHLTKAKSNLLLMTKYGLTFGGVNIVAKILEIFQSKSIESTKAKFLHTILSILLNLVTIKHNEERRWNKCILKASDIISHCCQKKVLMSHDETFCPLEFTIPGQKLTNRQNSSRGSTPESEDDSDSESDNSDSEDNQEQDNQDVNNESSYQNSESFSHKSKKSTEELQNNYGRIFKEFKGSHFHDSTGFLKETNGLYSLPKTSSTFHFKERSKSVESVYSFEKIALPDLLLAESPKDFSEPLLQKNRKSQRSKLMKCVRNMFNEEVRSGFPRVIYDLDDLINSPSSYNEELSSDEGIPILGNIIRGNEDLVFESRFESGNLRKVVQVNSLEYNLIITPDINTNNHCQWFYFSVSNTKAGIPYDFNIINYEKKNSQFNFGMQPVFFSSIAALHYGSPFWRRIGTDVGYGKNQYTVSSPNSDDSNGKDVYMTASFTIEFPYDNDVVYLAYHYPYTYTRLRVMLDKLKWKQEKDSSIYYREDILCHSLCYNEVPVLTITSSTILPEEKEIIFLTARVHPGETNASWIMEGTLCFILSSKPEAIELRNNYIFKIIPMLNVEGVIHGSHRCGLTGEDLNRQWMSPSFERHPSIFHSKGLIDFCHRVLEKPLYLFCDYHGHSRKKNVFLYGCSPHHPKVILENMAQNNEKNDEIYEDFLELEKVLGEMAPYFDPKSCKYNVEKCRETTARVVVWKEFGVNRSYTMESTFCGCNKGTHKGMQISTIHLKDMGTAFAKRGSLDSLQLSTNRVKKCNRRRYYEISTTKNV
ncbi:AGTPBP1 [Lepeophtheirus salmonis]|uniref:AGTPBP1 n=1 Tax=Lepeophtheirus salmonis TaxID=72036 RepID=A0A7R8CSA2_LEPSM|nr:AGTPBP1 [Lepeophtheirus salmonis]CAF2914939.1 AGTPBP1 [Lepeophtheirus salmonis]